MQLPISDRMRAFLANNPTLETPFLLIDLDLVEQQYRLLQEALPFVICYYAVKSNAASPVIQRLHQLGSRFETASIFEIRKCLDLGVAARDIHFGNTIKKASHIAEAYRLGIRSFSFDSLPELDKLAEQAPGAGVSCRLATDGLGAVWGLSRKFGREPDEVVELMTLAQEMGLHAIGLSFHVGSQQLNPDAWRRAIERCGQVLQHLAIRDIHPTTINIGGGYPSFHYMDETLKPEVDLFAYGQVIKEALATYCPPDVHCVMEPGRFLCAAAGIIQSEVVLVAEKPVPGGTERWVYLDIGRFNGLYEAADLTFPMLTTCEPGPVAPVILAGPTCDSDDILYDRDRAVPLPLALSAGDKVIFTSVGAYSRSYMTHEFNGFPPLREYYI